MSKKTVYS